jgi:cell wall-associated NlpC family hydrolase
MPTKNDVAKVAREFVGIPYQHQARCKPDGAFPGATDCIGLIYLVCEELNLLPQNFSLPTYGQDPYGQQLLRNFEQYCTPLTELEEGAVLIFTIRREPQHCAIYSRNEIIHAYDGVDSVVANEYTEWWKQRCVGKFRLMNVSG